MGAEITRPICRHKQRVLDARSIDKKKKKNIHFCPRRHRKNVEIRRNSIELTMMWGITGYGGYTLHTKK